MSISQSLQSPIQLQTSHYHAFEPTSSQKETSEKPARKFILAKNLSKYESERSEAAAAASSALAASSFHGENEKLQISMFPQEKKHSQSHMFGSSLNPLYKHHMLNLTSSKLLLKPTFAASEKKLQNIVFPPNNLMPTLSFTVSGEYHPPHSIAQSEQNLTQQPNDQPSVAENTSTVPIPAKIERNIFASTKNKVNSSMYKEFNIGPRTDKDGKIVQYSLVGNPQWFSKQRDLLERGTKNRQNQPSRDNNGRTDEELSRSKTKIFYKNLTHQSSNRSIRQSTSQSSEKSIGSLRLDTTQSVVKQGGSFNSLLASQTPQQQQQQQPVQRKKKRNETSVEISKEEVIREFETIQRRHERTTEAEQRALNSMSLDKRNIYTRDERVIQKYHEQMNDWDNQINQISKLSEREPLTSCMLRGDEHRRKIELMQAFDNLKTDEERFGKRIWYMYLRKYQREKKSEIPSSSEERVRHRSRLQDSLGKTSLTATSSTFTSSNTQKRDKIKLRELIDPNENTQSDIFSGFMTVSIHNQNKEIEVIRKIQDPKAFHLSSTGFNPSFRKTSSQFFISNQVKDSSVKLKNKMVVLDQPIDDFIVIGKNKLESEKNSVVANRSPFFSKLLQVGNQDSEQPDQPAAHPITMGQKQTRGSSQDEQSLQQIIEKDYNMNELSRTGQLFFPQIVDRISNAATRAIQ